MDDHTSVYKPVMIPWRPSRRLLLALFLVLLFFSSISRFAGFNQVNGIAANYERLALNTNSHSLPSQTDDDGNQSRTSPAATELGQLNNPADAKESIDLRSLTTHVLKDTSQLPHRVLFSASTRDREFMRVYLGDIHGYNINIIPHPTKVDFWILVAQRHQQYAPLTPEQQSLSLESRSTPPLEWPCPSQQIACAAGIQNDNVICAETATPLTFESQEEGVCLGDLNYISLVLGARDSRIFWGPQIPYMMYGAKSKHICFGQWLQDARSLLVEFKPHRHMAKEKAPFRSAVELPRPSDGKIVEKNYFLFWDANDVPYVHYTLWPKRAFSMLKDNGTGSADMAPSTAYHDQICMAKFMPPVGGYPYESIHQATNSLTITMCKRSDSQCRRNDSNTFIMHLFHHKSYYQYHAVYEPYVILFHRYAPFAIHAIGQRPFWIHGRHNLTEATEANVYKNNEVPIPEGHTEMFYVTSMNWKGHSQKNHGYVDDVLFISFGIEDTRPGIIDIVAGDLFDDLAYC